MKRNNEQLKKHILGISKFYQENVGGVKPFPKVHFSEANNPGDFLDKTGFYQPETKKITLFCNGRADKDIAKTFIHELKHHEQNLRGDLTPEKIGESSDNYTNGSDHLKKMESEAYSTGELFRQYTESLKKS